MRTVALDWSGRATRSAETIWTAVAHDGRLVELANGRDRDDAVAHLLDLASLDPDLVVGLDFSFSLPGWFARSLGAATGPELWEVVAERGERWLRACEPPFWGRPGRRRPGGDGFRRTELDLGHVAGIRPKSTFQIGGAGAVGTGSLRGMPRLRDLRGGGFAVWPFDDGRTPVAVEIWPRLLTGPVVKSDAGARRAYLAARFPDVDAAVAAGSEDAFDAAVSALVMDRHRAELLSLPPARDDVDRLEGRVWMPAGRPPATTT